MPHSENSHLRKLMTLLLVAGWLVWSIGMAQGALARGNVVFAGHTVYELFSFVVVYAFARQHHLEVQNLIGVGTSQNDSDDGGD